MTRTRWIAALALVFAVALPACGNKDNGGVITPSGDSSTTVTSTSAP